MSVRVTIDLPEGAFSALKLSPDAFIKELRLAAAVKWYEVEMISQSKAAEIAGVSRHDFLVALSRFKVSPFQVTAEEIAEELKNNITYLLEFVPATSQSSTSTPSRRAISIIGVESSFSHCCSPQGMGSIRLSVLAVVRHNRSISISFR